MVFKKTDLVVGAWYHFQSYGPLQYMGHDGAIDLESDRDRSLFRSMQAFRDGWPGVMGYHAKSVERRLTAEDLLEWAQAHEVAGFTELASAAREAASQMKE